MSRSPSHHKCASTIAKLGTSERYCLTILRLWVEERLGIDKAGINWREGFAHAGIPSATVEAFDTFMMIVASTAKRQLDVRPSTSGCVSKDELEFLKLVSCVQAGCFPKFQHILSGWIPTTAVRAATMPFAMVAGALDTKAIRIHDTKVPLADRTNNVSHLGEVDWSSQTMH